jgi:hypothetical protein
MNRLAAYMRTECSPARPRLFYRKWGRVLLAHEDLEVSNEWRGRIVDELRTCDVLTALLGKTLGGHPKPAIDGHLKTGHHTT